MSNILTILLINSDRASRTVIADLLSRCRRPVEVSASVASLQEGMKYLESDTPPQVIVLEAQSIAQGVRDISAILANNPHAMIIVTSMEKHPDWILTLIRAGAGEYLTTPINTEELDDAVERTARMLDQKQGVDETRGKIITVYNPSGGMGTTSIAVNLAATLSAKGEMTTLVDLNPFSNDITAFLDLTPAYTLSSLQETVGQIDASFLMGIMTKHASGLKVLCGPEEVGAVVGITPNQILNLLTLVKSQFGVTIIDTGGSLSERNLETFNGSDIILYPLTLTLPALNNARRYLKALSRLGFGPDRVKVVVNRYLPKDDIRISDAERILGVKSFHTIPNSYVEIKESIYKGTPLVVGYPRSLVTKALTELTSRTMAELSNGSH